MPVRAMPRCPCPSGVCRAVDPVSGPCHWLVTRAQLGSTCPASLPLSLVGFVVLHGLTEHKGFEN